MDLLYEMKRCKTVDDCHEVATTDAYGDEEQANGWLVCIEEMFGKFDRVNVFAEEVTINGFDLKGMHVVVKCLKGKKSAYVSLESVKFPKLSSTESLWLKAWKQWSAE